MTLDEFVSDWQSDSPTLLVHTSGSTGKPKPKGKGKPMSKSKAKAKPMPKGKKPFPPKNSK